MCESSFGKLIKTYFKSTMIERPVKNLMLIGIEHGIVTKLYPDESLQKHFDDLKLRRKRKFNIIVF